MTHATDRYARQGGPIPQIYPGTLAGLSQALKDCLSASKFLPGVILRLYAVHGKNRTIIRTFKGGACTWQPEDSELST